MQFPNITRQEALKFAQDPKNYLLCPIVFLGNALPYFFESLARGAYVDILSRSVFTALNYTLSDKISPLIAPAAEKIRQTCGHQINYFIQDLHGGAQWMVKDVILPFCGLDPNELFSNKALTKTALSIFALATALFTTSVFTGAGILPLFWAYQNMRVIRSVSAFAIDLYLVPQRHPTAWRVINSAHQLIGHMIDH